MKVYGWQAEIWPYIEELRRYEIELLMARSTIKVIFFITFQ